MAVHAVGVHRVALDRLEQRDAGIAVAEHDRIALAVPDVGEPALHREHVRIPGDRALHVGHDERDVVEALRLERRHPAPNLA